MAPLTMRTWVRTDGMILRQEVPFPFVRLVLERRPEDVIARNPPRLSSESSTQSGAGIMIEVRGVTKRFGSQVRRRWARPGGPRRRAVRIPRAQRRGQDDHDQDDLRPARARRRARVRVGGFDASSQRGPPAARLRPRPALSLRQADRSRVPQVRRRDVRARPATRPRADRRADRDVRDGRLRRRAVRELLAGDEAARRLRLGAGARPQGAGRRRAAGRPRPAECPDRQGPVRRAGPVGVRRADVDPPAGDRRGAGRQDRDRRPRPDAGHRHARPAPRTGAAPRAARRAVPEADRRPAADDRRRDRVRRKAEPEIAGSNHERLPSRSRRPLAPAADPGRADRPRLAAASAGG